MIYNRHKGDKEKALGAADFHPFEAKKAAARQVIARVSISEVRNILVPGAGAQRAAIVERPTVAGPLRSIGPLP